MSEFVGQRWGLHVAIAACVATLAGSPRAAGVVVDTGDGLAVTFSDADGAVTEVAVDGVSVPLLPGGGGVAVRVGKRVTPFLLASLDFDSGAAGCVAARNADWNSTGSYVTWVPDGGIGGSGHLLLGDGVTAGAGMALGSNLPVAGGRTVRISWQARSASVETTQILCVRILDAAGNDITAATPAPKGWSWTSTSQAHGVWGLHCRVADTWEPFQADYLVPSGAASIRVSLRHWTGGDHWVHVDDSRIDVIGGIEWLAPVAVRGPVVPADRGFRQDVDVAGLDLRVGTSVATSNGFLRISLDLQDVSSPMTDRPVVLYWVLPVAATGWQWWDDIDTSRAVAPGAVFGNTFSLAGRAVSRYPFSSVTGGGVGLSLAVPMEEPVVQRFECDAAAGLRSVWEVGLSPVTAKLGAGRAGVSLVLCRHDAAWGFRAATRKYQALFPEYFVKRTPREGAWMYPIHPSQIPDPLDFGFAYHETWPLDAAERTVCAQYDIGIHYYTEPWLAWQAWGNLPEKPSYEDRVARIESWAACDGSYATWLPDGGVGDSGCLRLGDGCTPGAGMAAAEPFSVSGGDRVNLSWQGRVADALSTQILCVRVFDAAGGDITAASAAPGGWFWSSTSLAHTVAGIANGTAGPWEPFSYAYVLPPQAAAMRVSLRHWTGGDHLADIDDLRVSGASTYLAMDFDADNGPWLSALNSDWEDAGPTWLRVRRQWAAEAVINSSPLDAEGRYLIDGSGYLWHEWAPDSWNQGWPLNPDPDLPSPNTYELYRDHWILNRIDETDGVYIDSVITEAGLGDWENRRADHLAFVDSPLTFAPADGGAVQLAPQAHAEFLEPIAEEVRGRGKVMMLNLFPDASRFHAHHADVMGSEVWDLVESDVDSRLRRTLAGTRIVSNLLQWGWDLPTYITYEQMEQFIRGQLFWGFYPAVSSAGGPMTGGAPDRYFLHPEMYERDRPLFERYMPVVRSLSTAGWEPVTGASAAPVAQIERFGDFSRGPVFLTVRGPQGAAITAEVTLDLTACGLADATWRIEGSDVLPGLPLSLARSGAEAAVRFAVALTIGEVGVYRFETSPFSLGDLDEDHDVDLEDYRLLSLCMIQSGPGTPLGFGHVCRVTYHADVDGDEDIDLGDFAVFQAACRP